MGVVDLEGTLSAWFIAEREERTYFRHQGGVTPIVGVVLLRAATVLLFDLVWGGIGRNAQHKAETGDFCESGRSGSHLEGEKGTVLSGGLLVVWYWGGGVGGLVVGMVCGRCAGEGLLSVWYVGKGAEWVVERRERKVGEMRG